MKRLGVLVTVVATVGAYVGTVQMPAGAQTVSEQPFAGSSTGTQLSLNALQIGDVQVANVQQAFAGAVVNSQGLDSAVTNEMGQAVQPALPGKNSYGRGTGLELGALTNFPDAESLNQLVLSGLAQAAAPPNDGPNTESVAIDAPPVIFAGLLTGQAQAIYDPNTCVMGQPFSYGRGEAANVQVAPTGPGGPGGLVNTGADPTNNTANTRSFEYLVPNGDGTFALVSETRQLLAPIGIGAPVLGQSPLLIEVDGEFVMRVTASGKPGRPAVGPLNSGASIEFSDPLINVSSLGISLPGFPVTFSSLLGANGINLSVPLIADISIDGAPRAIGSEAAPTPPQIAADGTSVSAAYDLLQLGLLVGLPGLSGIDLRVGHMEGAASVPLGGIKCNIPVSKTGTPDPVQAGQDITFTIKIPEDPARFAELYACDLVNISAIDRHRVLEGNPRFRITGASNGGIIEGDEVRWPNLGNYTRGSPSIVLTVTVNVIGGAGVLEDVVDVQATLGNCTGGIAGQDVAGSARFDGGSVTGTARFVGPRVGRGTLAATGANDAKYLLFGGALLLGAVGVMGVRRRLRTDSQNSYPS